jgi:soluble lytic murein transglycosylase-like protein
MADSGVEQQLASAARQRQAMNAMQSSIARQASAVRKQAHASVSQEQEFFVLGEPELAVASATPACGALTEFQSRGLVESAARKAGLDPNLLQAVANQESAMRPCAVSAKGAMGIMQLMPATAADLGVSNPFDAAESLNGGAALLKQLMTRYSGDLNRVLGAYNAGPARVDAANGIPAIPETMNYVQNILGKLPY